MLKYFKGLEFDEIVQGKIHDEWKFVEKCATGKKGTKSLLIDRRTLEVTDNKDQFNYFESKDLNVVLVDNAGNVLKGFFSNDPDVIQFFNKMNSRLITRK